jgi:hypothetical protein
MVALLTDPVDQFADELDSKLAVISRSGASKWSGVGGWRRRLHKERPD